MIKQDKKTKNSQTWKKNTVVTRGEENEGEVVKGKKGQIYANGRRFKW